MNIPRFIALVLLIPLLTNCNTGNSSQTNSGESELITSETGLKYNVLNEGDGPATEKGQEIKTHCLLTLEDGTKIWSTRDENRTFDFIYGETSLIPGFNEMISLMNVGDKVRATIPPELGYGARGAGEEIPPNATLIFEIEILDMN